MIGLPLWRNDITFSSDSTAASTRWPKVMQYHLDLRLRRRRSKEITLFLDFHRPRDAVDHVMRIRGDDVRQPPDPFGGSDHSQGPWGPDRPCVAHFTVELVLTSDCLVIDDEEAFVASSHSRRDGQKPSDMRACALALLHKQCKDRLLVRGLCPCP